MARRICGRRGICRRERGGLAGNLGGSSRGAGQVKTIVVTGAAQGVGLATASLLAQRDSRVILLDLNPVDAAVQRLCGGGGQAAGMTGDVSSEAFVQRVAQWIAAEFGAADGLVNNAGISLIAPALQTSAAQWQRVLS